MFDLFFVIISTCLYSLKIIFLVEQNIEPPLCYQTFPSSNLLNVFFLICIVVLFLLVNLFSFSPDFFLVILSSLLLSVFYVLLPVLILSWYLSSPCSNPYIFLILISIISLSTPAPPSSLSLCCSIVMSLPLLIHICVATPLISDPLSCWLKTSLIHAGQRCDNLVRTSFVAHTGENHIFQLLFYSFR